MWAYFLFPFFLRLEVADEEEEAAESEEEAAEGAEVVPATEAAYRASSTIHMDRRITHHTWHMTHMTHDTYDT